MQVPVSSTPFSGLLIILVPQFLPDLGKKARLKDCRHRNPNFNCTVIGNAVSVVD